MSKGVTQKRKITSGSKETITILRVSLSGRKNWNLILEKYLEIIIYTSWIDNITIY